MKYIKQIFETKKSKYVWWLFLLGFGVAIIISVVFFRGGVRRDTDGTLQAHGL